ncbi:hypothetical protein [Bacillus sp. LL01]|uniref:hypothetical protein n=1 Tax=Bacillus sp. LL01 TaxID=1665556 RepID=UPI0012FEA969|nr:hypothetical protein [Bacillus sp. LL01]
MRNETIYKCYCQARKAQAFYSKCLDNTNFSPREKEIIYELIKEAAETSNRLKAYCSE